MSACPCINDPLESRDFGHGVTVTWSNTNGCTCTHYVDATLNYRVASDAPDRSHDFRRHDVRAHAAALVEAQDWIDQQRQEQDR